MHRSLAAAALAVTAPSLCHAAYEITEETAYWFIRAAVVTTEASRIQSGSTSVDQSRFIGDEGRFTSVGNIHASAGVDGHYGLDDEPDGFEVSGSLEVNAGLFWDDITNAEAAAFESSNARSSLGSRVSFTTDEAISMDVSIFASVNIDAPRTKDDPAFTAFGVRRTDGAEETIHYAENFIGDYAETIVLGPGSYAFWYFASAQLELEDLPSPDGSSAEHIRVFFDAAITTIPTPSAALLFPLAVFTARRR